MDRTYRNPTREQLRRDLEAALAVATVLAEAHLVSGGNRELMDGARERVAPEAWRLVEAWEAGESPGCSHA